MSNKYLNFRVKSEQDLTDSLIREAISIHAEDFYYIPRKLVSVDEVFGEDRLSEFKKAYPIEAYFESITDYEGSGEILQRFGSFIDHQATLLLSRSHWAEAVGRFGESILPNRPAEGDLLYYPLTDSLFVIKYVNDHNPYAMLGKFYTYKLMVELWQYSSEHIDTEIPEIDAFENLKTYDTLGDNTAWGGVVDVFLEQGGLGYKEPPFIHVKSVCGFGARFKVTLGADGSITSVKVIDGGEGYHSEDIIEVIGNCVKPAHLVPKIRTQIEKVNDMWGSNTPLEEEAEKAIDNYENLFGDLQEFDDGTKPIRETYPAIQGIPDLDSMEEMSDNNFFLDQANGLK